MTKVFVASTVKGLAAAVRILLPKVEVIDVDLDSKGGYEMVNKQKLEENAEILLADVPVIADIMYTNKRLTWAQSTWAGIDAMQKHLDPNKAVPSFQLTRTGGAFSRLMSEYVLGYIIARERHILEVFQEQQKRNWTNAEFKMYRPLSQLRIGILGVGEIGKEIARSCKTFGMSVWGLTRTRPIGEKMCSAVDIYKSEEELPELLQSCDYICNVLPSTKDTQNLLSGDTLSRCQEKRGIFINIGRGTVIDDASLVNALRKNWIGGAVLDVFNNEPLPADSPLWSLPNVIITPHISGTSMPQPVAETFAANYTLYKEGKPLEFLYSWEHGY
ncbi:hypothetical protein CHS0354_039355 [Potamilus streckersoni]|uniref:D-isomer specific 2-hydroxyacid dehydrogenase NAD-binding domain-containing protein n=1 Tax=Potamilus streckersoni TaxID=2493646 RepID=A0AAE0T3J0_9BIVA|nr:hypothetical protein CHS0354_039355 [Potamilus streckersoni]